VGPRLGLDIFGEETNYLSILGIEHRLLFNPACSLLTTPTELACSQPSLRQCYMTTVVDAVSVSNLQIRELTL
jgi:hypothetical protein